MKNIIKTLGIGCMITLLSLGLSNGIRTANASDISRMIGENHSTELKEASENHTLDSILQTQFETHKEIQGQDAYKLLHQGTFGPAHDVRSSSTLYNEFENAKPNKDEPIAERISQKYPLYRVNIRSYKASGGNKETLFKWFQDSSKVKTGSAKEFLESWNTLKKFLKENKDKIYLTSEELNDFEARLAAICIKQNITSPPAVSHTPQYRHENNPSYVVVNFDVMPSSLKKYFEKK